MEQHSNLGRILAHHSPCIASCPHSLTKPARKIMVKRDLMASRYPALGDEILLSYIGIRPPKSNMEPEHDGFQKVSPLPGCHFQVNLVALWEGKDFFSWTNQYRRKRCNPSPFRKGPCSTSNVGRGPVPYLQCCSTWGWWGSCCGILGGTEGPYHPWDWCTYLHERLIFMLDVGKYTRLMDGMG